MAEKPLHHMNKRELDRLRNNFRYKKQLTSLVWRIDTWTIDQDDPPPLPLDVRVKEFAHRTAPIHHNQEEQSALQSVNADALAAAVNAGARVSAENFSAVQECEQELDDQHYQHAEPCSPSAEMQKISELHYQEYPSQGEHRHENASFQEEDYAAGREDRQSQQLASIDQQQTYEQDKGGEEGDEGEQESVEEEMLVHHAVEWLSQTVEHQLERKRRRTRKADEGQEKRTLYNKLRLYLDQLKQFKGLSNAEMAESLNCQQETYESFIEDEVGIFKSQDDQDRFICACKRFVLKQWQSLTQEESAQLALKLLEKQQYNQYENTRKTIPGVDTQPVGFVHQKVPPGCWIGNPQDLKTHLQPIQIQLRMANRVAQETLLYDTTQNNPTDVYRFALAFLRDVVKEGVLKGVDKRKMISCKKFNDWHMEIFQQIMSQVNKKEEILQFSSELSQFDYSKLAGTSVDRDQQLIKMQLNVCDTAGRCVYRDNFEWDVMQDSNEIEKFAITLVHDESLNPSYAGQIALQMRNQVVNFLQQRAQRIKKFYPQLQTWFKEPEEGQFLDKEQMRKNISLVLNEQLQQLPGNYYNISDFQTKKKKLRSHSLVQTCVTHFDVLEKGCDDIIRKSVRTLYKKELKRDKKIDADKGTALQTIRQVEELEKYLPKYVMKRHSPSELHDILVKKVQLGKN